MPIGILGRKKYMTRVFLDTGKAVPVTVIECPENIVRQVKTSGTDGYNAICLNAFERKRPSKQKTHYLSKEIRVKDEEALEGVKRGSKVSLKDFSEVKEIEIVGTSKGKGFQGVIKRHGFSGGPASHGSHFKRQAGSVGNCKPARSPKGIKLAGQMGGERITLKKLEVIKIDPENNLIAIKGSIPGGRNSFLTLIVK